MADYVTLLGAEQVQSAANTMKHAAEEMTRAASSLQWALEQHERRMTEWLDRFEMVLNSKESPHA